MATKKLKTKVIEPSVIPIAVVAPIVIKRVEPKDLAEAQDLAEAAGIDYVGRNLIQLTAYLNGETPGHEATKKVIKLPLEHEVSTNVHPTIKAAIDKANAEIAIARAKVSELRENAKKIKDENKVKLEAEKAVRVAKIKADNEAKEIADKELAGKKSEIEKFLLDEENVLAGSVVSLALIQSTITLTKLKIAEYKKVLGLKKERGVIVVRVKDLTKYTPGTEYEIEHEGATVKVLCKNVFTGSKTGNKFYKFNEVGTGRIIRRRAHAEEVAPIS